MEKFECLLKYLKEKEKLAVAFSGGVDSAFLLKAANIALPGQIKAYMAETSLHPLGDRETAVRLADELKVPLEIIKIDEFSNPDILENPVNRCYLCKKMIFSMLLAKTKEDCFPFLADGTNADDMKVYRPGIAALSELCVLSPLKEMGYTKQEIRRDAHALGISVAQRPSAPCLATRLPYGTKITKELLRKIDEGEEKIKALTGISTLRLRVHGDIARIEILREDFEKLLEISNISQEIQKLGFHYVTLDLAGFRSGSMDEGLFKEGEKE